MQNTTWYNFNKPDGTDSVDVLKINENFDTIDQQLHNAQLTTDNQGSVYDNSKTYFMGDLVLRNNVLYRCNTPIEFPETWNEEHWTQTTFADVIVELSNTINYLLNMNG